jgi:signal transduction histidine kinase
VVHSAARQNAKRPAGSPILYCALLAGCFLFGIYLKSTGPGRQLDDSVYDFFFRHYQPPPWETSSILLTIDSTTLDQYGTSGVRKALAAGLNLIHDAHPRAVAVDIILAAPSEDDALLEAAFAATHNLVLPCQLNGTKWEDPIPRFKRYAAALGEVHVEPVGDAVARYVELYKVTGHRATADQRWSLGLEAYRVSRGVDIIVSPDDLQVGDVIIPAVRDPGDIQQSSYRMRIRYVPASMPQIPHVSIAELAADPAKARLFAGKVVFAGVSDQTAARDRWMTPLSDGTPMAGIEMNANIYETIANRLFLTDAHEESWLLAALMMVVAAGLIWRFTGGMTAPILSVGLLAVAHLFPYWLFTRGIVFPYVPAVLPAWFALIAAASWQYFYVRRRLGHSEAEKTRYQQAIHFVTHEMRTPLTAIQGSSELINRYPAMPEAKRKQINDLIVSESHRLGRMIEVFLNVERLSAGDMQLKHDDFPLPALIENCVARARPLAERKQIAVTVEGLPSEEIRGDRELMEYAFYNLLTNAIKYSPAETQVRVFGSRENGRLRISVEDQGIGMDQKEVRRIFEKFYRTRRAEQSGEAGTGIGLSIVEQIVTQHGGSIDVVSTPGRGSCFTLVLPAGKVHA